MKHGNVKNVLFGYTRLIIRILDFYNYYSQSFIPSQPSVALLYPLTRSAEIIKDFDIFVISESKLDSVFPNAQLKVTGIKFFRYD